MKNNDVNVLIGISSEQNVIDPKMGSEVQTLGYSEALANNGHTVYLVNILRDTPDWSIDYDIVHLINAGGYKSPYMFVSQIAREKGIPTVISPVYWPVQEVMDEIISADLAESVEGLKDQFNQHLEGTAKMLTFADWLLPNAEVEMKKVIELLNGKMLGQSITMNDVARGATGYTVIHNGVDVEGEINLALQDDNPVFSDEFERLLHERFVLCVARVEPRKNQLNLIKAVDILCEEDPDLQVVLMGMRSKPYVDYIKENKIGKNVLYCPPGPKAAVLRMMKRCSLHCMASYIETPGLANLEAAAINKPVVIGDRGSVREYFYDLPGVFYVDPRNPEDIAEKIKSALDFGEANELGEFIRGTYSYRQIAYKLEMVYKQVIRDYGRK